MFRSVNASESFQSTTSQFSLEKVCLALQSDVPPPTYIVPYKIKEWSTRRLTVARLSPDCRPTVGRCIGQCVGPRFTLSFPFPIKSNIILLASVTTSLSIQIDPARYINSGITKVLMI